MSKHISYTKEEALEKLDIKHNFIINNIECTMSLYLHSRNYFSILYNTYDVTFSEYRNSYVLCESIANNAHLGMYLNSNEVVEITEKISNKKGYYNFVLNNSIDGVKFLYGDDL